MKSTADLTLEQITELRAKERTKNLETFEAIKAYYLGNDPISLSPKQEEIRRRWHAVYLKKLNRISDEEVAKTLQTEFGIGQSQSYQDIVNSKRLFGIAGKSDRDLNRQIAEKMSLETFQIAKEQRSARDMAAATKAFIDSSGVKDDMTELPNFEKLEPNTYVVMLDPTTQALIEQLLTKPTINLSDLVKDQIDDLEYEEG